MPATIPLKVPDLSLARVFNVGVVVFNIAKNGNLKPCLENKPYEMFPSNQVLDLSTTRPHHRRI